MWICRDRSTARPFFFAVILFCLIAGSFSGISSASAHDRTTIHCSSQNLYRGETLKIDIRGPHEGYYFGVWSSQEQRFRLITFQPQPDDPARPLISSHEFGEMANVNLVGGTTLGLPQDLSAKPGHFNLGAPEKVFATTGLYQVELGALLWTEDGDFDACWVHYYDYPRPKGEPAPKQTPQPR